MISKSLDLDIKLVFPSFKIGNLLGVKDSVPDGLHSRVVCKFEYAGCNAYYISGIFPHVLESTWSMTGPLTFSGI